VVSVSGSGNTAVSLSVTPAPRTITAATSTRITSFVTFSTSSNDYNTALSTSANSVTSVVVSDATSATVNSTTGGVRIRIILAAIFGSLGFFLVLGFIHFLFIKHQKLQKDNLLRSFQTNKTSTVGRFLRVNRKKKDTSSLNSPELEKRPISEIQGHPVQVPTENLIELPGDDYFPGTWTGQYHSPEGISAPRPDDHFISQGNGWSRQH